MFCTDASREATLAPSLTCMTFTTHLAQGELCDRQLGMFNLESHIDCWQMLLQHDAVFMGLGPGVRALNKPLSFLWGDVCEAI